MSGESPGELNRFFDDVEELLRRVSNLHDEDISRLRQRVESSIGQAKSAADEGLDSAMRGARTAAQGADAYVRENPWTAVAVAAAAGLLLGSLLTRR